MAALRRYVDAEPAPRPEVRQVILIGSLARGDHTPWSDADLVVIVDRAFERGPLRGAAYAPRAPVGLAVDLPEEARRWSPRFLAEVEGGVTLYACEDGEAPPGSVGPG